MIPSLLLGLLAGAITTVAGMGGGLVLLLALAVLTDPIHALAVTGPALLVGNLHRSVLLRAQVDRATVLPLVVGVLPGAFIGGFAAVALPEWSLRALMAALALFAVAQAAGWVSWRPPAAATSPYSAVAGFVGATSGGAGVLFGSLMLARGLRGRTLVATLACGAVAMHAARTLAYALGGVAGATVLVEGLGLAVAIVAGNLVGRGIARVLGERNQGRVQVAVLVTTAGLAVAGLA